jgi:hypothetical protein
MFITVNNRHRAVGDPMSAVVVLNQAATAEHYVDLVRLLTLTYDVLLVAKPHRLDIGAPL